MNELGLTKCLEMHLQCDVLNDLSPPEKKVVGPLFPYSPVVKFL